MLRAVTTPDRELFCQLCDEFYHTNAVLHPVNSGNFVATFDQIISNSPYVSAYFVSSGDDVAGYIQLSFTFANEVGGRVMLIEELYIRPHYQGQGLGSRAINEAISRYPDVKRIRLEIEPDNLSAKKLYQRLGFAVLGYQSMTIDKI